MHESFENIMGHFLSVWFLGLGKKIVNPRTSELKKLKYHLE